MVTSDSDVMTGSLLEAFRPENRHKTTQDARERWLSRLHPRTLRPDVRESVILVNATHRTSAREAIVGRYPKQTLN
jgi:hypothetical protein